MSDFSVNTHESELMARENLLDLRISTGQFDKEAIAQILGCSLSIADHELQTMLVVDFYNHESKSTDRCTGYQPVYNTLITFKNTVDDFYIRHL